MVLLAYTSSGPWRGAALRTPPGVIEFDAAQAKVLGQKPFHIDLRTPAKVTLTLAWFPRLRQEDRGIVGIAGKAVRNRILHAAKNLIAVSPEIVETRGVGSQTAIVARRSTRPT